MFSTDNPSHLAYKIREAATAAKHHKETKEKFGNIMDLYEFRVLPGKVVAELATGPPEAKNLEPIIANAQEMDPTQQAYYEAMTSTTLVNARNLDEVIGGAIKYAATVDEIAFPSAILKPDDLARLYRWAVTERWKIINQEDWGITLTKRDVDPEMEWKPDGEIRRVEEERGDLEGEV